MANILHLETTTLNCGVAIFCDSTVVSSRSNCEEGYSHAENIMPFIDEVFVECGLSKSDLDAVSVSGGPGSYTGLRIGVATAKGICHALSIPLISVDTLSVLKHEAVSLMPGKDTYVSMLDARRMEVYTKTFTKDHSSEVKALVVDTTTKSVFDEHKTICFIGDGVEKCEEILAFDGRDFIKTYPKSEYAIDLVRRAFEKRDFVDIASYEPMYLKAFKAGVAKDPFNLRDKTSRFTE